MDTLITLVQAAESVPESGMDAASGNTAEAIRTADSLGMFSWGGYVQALLVMAVLLFALWGLLWIIRRLNRAARIRGGLPGNALQVEAQIAVAPRRSLMIIRFYDKRVLVGMTEQGMRPLSESYIQVEGENPQDFAALVSRGTAVPPAPSSPPETGGPAGNDRPPE